ncbi:MAG: FHA domain-containing protein [Cyanobacteria bacterium P01_A01_bin.114]
MSGEPVILKLIWEDPLTGNSHNAALQLPIAIGREAAKMPAQLGDQSVSHLELVHQQVSRHHALITLVNRQLQITDKSANGTFLNGRPVRSGGQVFTPKDTIRIGPFKITAAILNADEANSTELNRDHSHLAKTEAGTNPNAILIWLLGGGILLVLGAGVWLIAQVLLNQARPTVDPVTEPTSGTYLNIADISSGVEVGALETTQTVQV